MHPSYVMKHASSRWQPLLFEYNLKIRPRANDAVVRRDRHPDNHLVCFALFLSSRPIWETLTLEKTWWLSHSLSLGRLIRFTGIGQLSKAIISLSHTVSPLSEFPNTFFSTSLSSIYNIITDCTKKRLRSLPPPSLFKNLCDPFRKRDRCRPYQAGSTC